MDIFTKRQLCELDTMINNYAKTHNFSPVTITMMVGLIYSAQRHALDQIVAESLRDKSNDN